ncbi:MAG: hypothetical protein KKB51_18790 [Candidatus Riflebacteria bacterium]|nr:hypothetical protein [Candidatus Riflebacteria bacterium]
MSNTLAVPTINRMFEEHSDHPEALLHNETVQKPVLKVVPPPPTEPPTLEALASMYAVQKRECWLCEGISRKIVEGKEISEDDNWHFTSCVLSWEHLHRS